MTPQQFRIDQLRKDNISYAVEATAASLACMVGMLASSVLLVGKPLTQLVVFVSLTTIAIGYTSYVGVTNYRRLQLIQKLESKL